MKTFNLIKLKLTTGILLVFLMGLILKPQKADARPHFDIGLEVFIHNLAPYGTWTQHPEFGLVWLPRVNSHFKPYYTNGYWINTTYGNMWVSHYNWGWATFHYGRWAYDRYAGWFWIPGHQWGPAWVVWRQGRGYYGWAPMQPGISINISFGARQYIPNSYWTFVPYRHLYTHNFNRYHRRGRNVAIINQTTIIRNTYVHNDHTYISGPTRQSYRRHTGRRVRTYRVNSSRRAGQSRVSNRIATVYRPEVDNRIHNRRTLKALSRRNNQVFRRSREQKSSVRRKADNQQPANRRSRQRVSRQHRTVNQQQKARAARTTRHVKVKKQRQSQNSQRRRRGHQKAVIQQKTKRQKAKTSHHPKRVNRSSHTRRRRSMQKPQKRKSVHQSRRSERSSRATRRR